MSCPVCESTVELTSNKVTLTLDESGSEGNYAFTCPECDSDVEKRADNKIVSLLISTDVVIEGWKLEGDWDEALHQELLCGVAHRWDFPVKLGQRCLCGEKEWGA